MVECTMVRVVVVGLVADSMPCRKYCGITVSTVYRILWYWIHIIKLVSNPDPSYFRSAGCIASPARKFDNQTLLITISVLLSLMIRIYRAVCSLFLHVLPTEDNDNGIYGTTVLVGFNG